MHSQHDSCHCSLSSNISHHSSLSTFRLLPLLLHHRPLKSAELHPPCPHGCQLTIYSTCTCTYTCTCMAKHNHHFYATFSSGLRHVYLYKIWTLTRHYTLQPQIRSVLYVGDHRLCPIIIIQSLIIANSISCFWMQHKLILSHI